MKNALLVIVTLIVAGLVVLGYLLYPVPYAAKVNGVVIRKQTLFSALAAIKANRAFICEQEASSPSPISIQGASVGSYSSSFAASELRNLILFRLLDQYASRHHARPSTAELASARKSIASALGSGASPPAAGTSSARSCPTISGIAVFDAFPSWYQVAQERAQAELTYFVTGLTSTATRPSAERKYYRSHPSQFVTVCLDALAFPTQGGAKHLRASISPGAKLASVATANHLHLLSACIPESQLPPSLASLPLGRVSKPVSNGPSGWVIAQPTSRKLEPFSKAVVQIKQQLSSSSSILASFLGQLAKKARVSINPLYGTWTGRWPQLLTTPVPPSASVLPKSTAPQSGTAPSQGSTSPGTG
ncbi:MAG: peptidylprolyl isomerase [Acidimicrobiales bacterium]